jgi:hypothetical protein
MREAPTEAGDAPQHWRWPSPCSPPRPFQFQQGAREGLWGNRRALADCCRSMVCLLQWLGTLRRRIGLRWASTWWIWCAAAHCRGTAGRWCSLDDFAVSSGPSHVLVEVLHCCLWLKMFSPSPSLLGEWMLCEFKKFDVVIPNGVQVVLATVWSELWLRKHGSNLLSNC